jgi:hypothetical protein
MNSPAAAVACLCLGLASHAPLDGRTLDSPSVANFSVVGFDPPTDDFRVGAQNKFFGVGTVVPQDKAGVGEIATDANLDSLNLRNLRCEYLTNPFAIDARAPRLSWELKSHERGQHQTAYQVLVASTPENLAQDEGDLWDSGRLSSTESIHIEYAGQALCSRIEAHWKARVWDKDGHPTAWSDPAR